MRKPFHLLTATLIFMALAFTFALSPAAPTARATQTCEDCQVKCQRKFDQCLEHQNDLGCYDGFNRCIVHCYAHFCEQ